MTNAESGVEMPLIDPVTRAKTDAVLVLYGADSSVCKAVDKEQSSKNKALGRALTAEEIADQVLEKLAR